MLGFEVSKGEEEEEEAKKEVILVGVAVVDFF